MENTFKKNSKPYLFIELAQPNEHGGSRKVSVKEFEGKYENLKFGNGGDWCRSDGSLAKKYIVKRHKIKGAIAFVELTGFNTKAQIKKNIRKDIHNFISKQRCAVLDISNVEVDHKDGHRDDYLNFNLKNQDKDQFQPLSKAANNAKKQHCKDCRNTKKRFDASVLGYKKGYWMGGNEYLGTCFGCYWHDIKKFNEQMSQNFV